VRRQFLTTCLGLLGLLSTQALNAQSPIGAPFLAHPPGIDQNGFQSQTVLANGDLLVAWESAESFDEGPMAIKGRRFSLHHGPGEVMTLVQGFIPDNGLYNTLVAPRADDGFLLTFTRFVDRNYLGCRAIAFSGDGQPLADEMGFAPKGGCGEGLVLLSDGSFGTSWLESDSSGYQFRAYRMFARLSSYGERISQPRRINPKPVQVGLSASLASLGGNANGDMTLVWDGHPAAARSFNAYGGPLPPLGFVGFTEFEGASVAVLPNGNRIFAGLNDSPDDFDSNYVAYQRFASDGTPLGRMRPAHTRRDALYGAPRLAADRFGNFVITWGSLPGTFCNRLEARLFRADGTPVGKEFFVNPVDLCEARPQVSFGNDGTFALSWVNDTGLNVAWFSASPGDEPCLTRGGRLICDTGRTGGLPEIDQPNATTAFDALFLADFDGDGRADPCFHSGTTFRCDLEHRGRSPRARVRFGEPTDLPLMGDIDGDGRAEACVRRGDLLACDTGHNGGRAEIEVRFGNPNHTPLLGDLDGDRRDDLCLFRDGVFTCDIAHNGGGAERTIRFGQPGDLPVLGDFDGDGRDDPCVLRDDTLLCDTKHDGGGAEASLRLVVQPGDGILMGNLDGL
jgi:hypothetical protein